MKKWSQKQENNFKLKYNIMSFNLSQALLDAVIDGLQNQFAGDKSQSLNDGLDVIQRIITIPLDENPDNKGQYEELLSVIGKAARDHNLLD